MAKKKQLEVGQVWKNKKAGTTMRRIVAITTKDKHPIKWRGNDPTNLPDEAVIVYDETLNAKGEIKNTGELFESSFRSWAGSLLDEV